MAKSLVQIRRRREYGAAIGIDTSDDHKWRGGDRTEQFNIPPGRWPWIIHRLGNGAVDLDTVRWGYQVPNEARLHTAISIERGMHARYFRHMLREGRCIVPIDGWFEYAAGGAEPWHVRLRAGQPMLAAGITNFRPYTVERPGTGFCLVTSTEPGFGDCDDYRLIILTPDGARQWIDPTTCPDEASMILQRKKLAAAAFHSYRVGRGVLDPDENGPELLSPV